MRLCAPPPLATVGEPRWYRVGSTRGWRFLRGAWASLSPNLLQGLCPPSSFWSSLHTTTLQVWITRGLESSEEAWSGLSRSPIACWGSLWNPVGSALDRRASLPGAPLGPVWLLVGLVCLWLGSIMQGGGPLTPRCGLFACLMYGVAPTLV